MSLRITGRDLKLFVALDEFGILSTGQIASEVFYSKDRPHVLRRLRKLRKRNLLRTFFGLPNGELVWALTEKGARGIGSSLSIATINRNSLEHDLLCADVKIKLDQMGVGSNWISSHAIQRMKKNDIDSDRIPDWIFKLNLKGKTLTAALEVELRLKGKRRLESILYSYARKNDIRFVWYLVPTESFGKKILEAMPLVSHDKGEHWLGYSLIDSILNDLSNVKIFTNGGEILLRNICNFPDPEKKNVTNTCPSQSQGLDTSENLASTTKIHNQLK